MERIALMGAGGKMGLRGATKLAAAGYTVDCVEPGARGRSRLEEAGFTPVEASAALPAADVVVLAVPDRLIGTVAAQVVDEIGPGTLVMCLDPAAPMAGKLPARDGIAYFVTHPCHPSIFKDEQIPEARNDHFGEIDAQLSDGAIKAAARGKARLLQPDWKDAFTMESIMGEIDQITGSE